MPSIDFEVYCAKCGHGLCNHTNIDYRASGVKLNIEPCPICLEDSHQEGYENGYEKGQQESEDK